MAEKAISNVAFTFCPTHLTLNHVTHLDQLLQTGTAQCGRELGEAGGLGRAAPAALLLLQHGHTRLQDGRLRSVLLPQVSICSQDSCVYWTEVVG